MIRITELQPGDEILAWMRIGMALKLGRNPDGTTFRYVPLKPSIIDTYDLPRFVGSVIYNDPDLRYFLVNVSQAGNNHTAIGESVRALIAYPVLQRVRKFSVSHQPARTSNPFNPTNTIPKVPYRTLEDVVL